LLLAAALLGLPAAAFAGADPGGPQARIVSVGAAVTETLLALGVGDRIVGVDTTSELPPEKSAIARVGYLRTLGAEGLLSLSPTLVIVSDEAGPTAVLEQVRATGTPCEVVTAAGAPVSNAEAQASASATTTIRRIAVLVGEQERGEKLVQAFEKDLADAKRAVATRADRPAALFVVHPPRAGSALVAGVGTPPDVMLKLAGADNAAAQITGYRPLTPEAAVASAPEVVVVPVGTLAAAGGARPFLESAGLGLTPAGRSGRVVEVQPWMLSFGPRTGRAVAELADLLHGQVGASASE